MNTWGKRSFAFATAFTLVAGISSGMAMAQTPTLSFTVYQPYWEKPATGYPLQNMWTRMMEKRLGQHLNITWNEIAETEYGTKEPTYLASGKLADVSLLLNPPDILEAGQEGAIVDLMPYLKNGDMPYYKKFLAEDGNLSKVETNGHLYYFADGLYSDASTNYGTQWNWTFRFDVFQKYHLPIPQTMQQLYDVALKLKRLYPKAYPIGAQYSGLASWYTLDTIFAVMDHTNTGFYFNGKKYAYGPVTDYRRFEDTIKYMAKLYAHGLIDPNFLTIQSSQFPTKADKGEFFIVPNGWGANMNNSQSINLNVKGFAGQWGTAAPPKNLYDQVSWKMGTDTVPGLAVTYDGGVVISSRASNIPQLVKLLDYQYSPDIINLYNYGVKGVTYTIGKDGLPHFTQKALTVAPGQEPSNSPYLNQFPVDPGSNVRIGIQWIPQSRSAENQLYGTVPVYMNGKYFQSTIWRFSAMSAGGVQSVNPNDFAAPLPLTTGQLTQNANTTTNLTNFLTQGLAKFILGKESFAQWPAFIRQLKAQGNIQQVLDSDNAALAQMEQQNHWSYATAIGISH